MSLCAHPRRLGQRAQIGVDGTRTLHEVDALLREAESAPVALEQRDADALLQLLQALAERGLREPQAHGRLAHRTEALEGDQGLYAVQHIPKCTLFH